MWALSCGCWGITWKTRDRIKCLGLSIAKHETPTGTTLGFPFSRPEISEFCQACHFVLSASAICSLREVYGSDVGGLIIPKMQQCASSADLSDSWRMRFQSTATSKPSLRANQAWVGSILACLNRISPLTLLEVACVLCIVLVALGCSNRLQTFVLCPVFCLGPPKFEPSSRLGRSRMSAPLVPIDPKSCLGQP